MKLGNKLICHQEYVIRIYLKIMQISTFLKANSNKLIKPYLNALLLNVSCQYLVASSNPTLCPQARLLESALSPETQKLSFSIFKILQKERRLIEFCFSSFKGCWRRSARFGCWQFELCRLAVSARPPFHRSLHQTKEIDGGIRIGTLDYNPSLEIGSCRVGLDHQPRSATSPLSHSPGKLDKYLRMCQPLYM